MYDPNKHKESFRKALPVEVKDFDGLWKQYCPGWGAGFYITISVAIGGPSVTAELIKQLQDLWYATCGDEDSAMEYWTKRHLSEKGPNLFPL